VKKPAGLLPENFVSLILNGEIRLENVTADLEDRLRVLGARRVVEGGETWSIPYETDEELAKLFAQLNQLKVLFVDQPAGWPPAAIFRDLRKRGLIGGSFKTVSWRGPGKWFVRAS
jgi:hypothetical protein